MKSIDSIRELDDRVFAAIEEPMAHVMTQLHSLKHGKTVGGWVMFLTKAGFLKNAIFDVSTTGDLYSAKILYRSLIENALRFQYLFFRYAKEKDDGAFEEYQLFADLAEDMEYGRAWMVVDQLSGTSRPNVDLWTMLRDSRSEFKRFTPKGLKEKVAHFRYRNIVRYINDILATPEGRPVEIVRWIPEYSELSSFVHGGPYADRFLFAHTSNVRRNEELYHVCEMASTIHGSIAEMIFLVLSPIDAKYQSAFVQLQTLRRATAS